MIKIRPIHVLPLLTSSLVVLATLLQSGCGPGGGVDPTFNIGTVTPSSGPLYGGTEIVLTGMGFDASTRATVGGRDCVTSKFVSDKEWHCVTPAGKAPGSVDVQIFSANDTSNAVFASGFKYACLPAAGSSGASGATAPTGLQVWANTGEDKVTQDDLRASCDPSGLKNPAWDGKNITVWGAKNEVVAFNLVLEAPQTAVNNVTVTFNQLIGPGGALIKSVPTGPSGIFNWTQRNIEQFVIRYLPINGLSGLAYNNYDERHVPHRLRRPWSGQGYGTGTWADRPDHDKMYPDIAVPIELQPSFNIAANTNQSVWTDIYIPTASPDGLYSGTVTVTADGGVSMSVPVQLTVHKFALPDVPTSKTMLYMGYTDLSLRYFGQPFVDDDPVKGPALDQIRDEHFMIAHRHKVSMVDDNTGYTVWSQDNPRPIWIGRLNGQTFSAANGYDGPGVGIGNGLYSVGNYGNWSWRDGTQNDMWTHTNAWEHWFEASFPDVERFLFLKDEPAPPDYPQIETWAQWMNANPGIGKKLGTFSTVPLPDAAGWTLSAADAAAQNAAAAAFGASGASGFPATSGVAQMNDLTTVCSSMAQGNTGAWDSALANARAQGKKFYMYNGKHPASGSFATDDDGVALREVVWGQYKKGIDRWFYWESTYYNDYQTQRGQNNLFHDGLTFGQFTSTDPNIGRSGYGYTNGDGVLFYPGTDMQHPADSYGLSGPMASIRLKLWRRGIQDADYLAAAAKIDPVRTQAIVNRMVPKVLWEVGLTNPGDPNYVRTPMSWSSDPADWEAARAELAAIIEGTVAQPSGH